MTTATTAPLTFATTRNPAPASAETREAVLADPGFGKHFTDHMVTIDWSIDEGWHDARVEPYGPLQLDPASAVLHYGQEVFEGLKAYRHADGSVHTFRPERNAARLRNSAHRLALPELSDEDFVNAIRELVTIDEAWVPAAGEGKALYLRPFMIAYENFLGVRSAHTARFMIIACPAGSYFSDPTKPVDIWLSEEYSRAGRGGTGAAKCGGNYAASLLPTNEAYANGCEQVLFLDAAEEKYLEELGGMNIVLVGADGTVSTPLSDSILPGITRDSVLELVEAAGHRVERRRISIDEWREGVASGEIVEAFACGTAAVITPIGMLKSPHFTIENPRVDADSLSMRIRAKLTGIQNGEVADERGWLTRLV
ncbi:branched-chain amino acid aminotransferase [Pseudoclavibacter chungangensis]|uniref:branched-chain-amino-acid transaminase n=1 Tax=Pseudoclavibacter chungangensis TaxID=587635 RepID=A0A7J5BMC2_9MICO|nr:branched-chain amino acid aminotransferase [Pseudoclavibacter chungangensis]KAB1652219.1 branched-chain amino acid aminotransferase [Pseudoclavibacter chungangensis]NYJ67591.1 branched-chain amino acid aminotransferase [Pseudoclavibacter chungangensis]